MPTTNDLALANRLRVLRAEREVSQEELAKRMGMSFQQLHKYETGANRVTFGRLCEIADALGYTMPQVIDPMFDGKGDTLPPQPVLRHREKVLVDLSQKLEPKQVDYIIEFMKSMVRHKKS